MRKFIEKINNWIQWTKQWHFFHVLFIGTLLLFSIFFFKIMLCIELIDIKNISIISIFNFIKTLLLNSSIQDIPDIIYFGLTNAFIANIFVYIMLIPSVLIEFLYRLKVRKTRQNFNVSSEFLLNNKVYNAIYAFAAIFVTVSFCLAFLCSLI